MRLEHTLRSSASTAVCLFGSAAGVIGGVTRALVPENASLAKKVAWGAAAVAGATALEAAAGYIGGNPLRGVGGHIVGSVEGDSLITALSTGAAYAIGVGRGPGGATFFNNVRTSVATVLNVFTLGAGLVGVGAKLLTPESMSLKATARHGTLVSLATGAIVGGGVWLAGSNPWMSLGLGTFGDWAAVATGVLAAVATGVSYGITPPGEDKAVAHPALDPAVAS